MKKILILMLAMLFLVGFASANQWEWDNVLDYENNDMTVKITDWLGLGGLLGNATLTSHAYPTEVRDVLAGKNRTVMYYDFDFDKGYSEGLGDVKFVDMKTGEQIQKDYYFAEAIYETRNNTVEQKKVCTTINYSNQTTGENCQYTYKYALEEVVVDWKKLNTNDIPSGKKTIALITDVNTGEKIDGQWKIAGKWVKKHASWSDSFNNKLFAYFSLNETTGEFIDTLGNVTTITNVASNSRGLNGIQDESVNFTKASDRINVTHFPNSISAFTVNFWVNDTDWFNNPHNGDQDTIFNSDSGCTNGATSSNFDFGIHMEPFGVANLMTAGEGHQVNPMPLSTIDNGKWVMMTLAYDGTTGMYYQNGSLVASWGSSGTVNADNNSMSIGSNCLERGAEATTWADKQIDEFMFWTRNLSYTEISTLWDDGTGTFFSLPDTTGPTITNLLEFPSDPQNFTEDQEYSFNATITDDTLLDSVFFEWQGTANYTPVNTVGDIFNVTLPFTAEAGTHSYRWLANDSSNNWNVGAETYTINGLNVTPTLYLNGSETNLSIMWPSEVNASANTSISQQTLVLYRDGVNIDSENGIFKQLSASSNAYNYTVSVQASDNYSEQHLTRYVALAQASSLINLTVNDTDANITIESGATIPINASLITGSFDGGSINLTEDEIQINFSSTQNISHKRTFNTLGDFNITAFYRGNENYTNATETHFIQVLDTTAPTVIIDAPTNTMNFGQLGSEEYINWTITDLITVDTCWFDYNNVNTTVTCGDNNATFLLEENIYNITMWANDSLDNFIGNTSNWVYQIVQYNQTFNNETIEGAVESFKIDLKALSALSFMRLIYDSVASSSILENRGEGFYKTTISKIIPNIASQTNLSFNWEINFADTTQIFTPLSNQSIDNLDLDDCTTFTNLIYNYTMFDEETQNKIVNGTIDVQLDLYDLERNNILLNFSQNTTNIIPLEICLNINLLNSTKYSVDSVVKYTSNETGDHAIEYYNILNRTLENSTIPNDIKLYPLLFADSTDFQLTFRDKDLVLFPNILVNIFRQYVGDGDFKTVEIPITDSNGQTILHLVRNDIIYNFVMVDIGGNIVATFNRVIAFCQDFTIGECTINLNAPSPGDQIYDRLKDVGITYSLSFNNVTNNIVFNFLSSGLITRNVEIIVEKNNDFGNRSVCSASLNSSSGIILCDVSSITSTDRFLFVNIFVDSLLKATEMIDLEAGISGFGVDGYFIAFLFILVIMTLFMNDKQTLVISLGIGWVVVIAFGLVRGALFGSASAGIWLVVTILIFIWKLKKEETG